ncbi:MAG: HlyD family efflux transporter periplasmic adaptor subunit [Verrucomicrobiota bacterium]
MIRKYLIPVLAAAGLTFAIWKVAQGSKAAPVAQPVVAPAAAPYRSFVAGAGIIEANSENIAIGTPIAGIVAAVNVRVGDHVPAGAPLFQIDDRESQAQLLARRANVAVAQARITEAESVLDTAKILFNLADSLADKRGISVEEMSRRTASVHVAAAKLAAASADLTNAAAQVTQAETDIELRTIRAPVAGEVLQVKIRRGEFAAAGRADQPLLMFGATDPLHVRVDVDENDAWRLQPGAAATGNLRGNNQIKMPLQFVRFEPYVIPKRSLTGDSTERVDTRVLQVIFRFDRGNLPVFVGQQVDVFIDAPEKKP